MNEILLMLPGPTTADPRVLQAMGKAVVNHRGDEFGEIYEKHPDSGIDLKGFQVPRWEEMTSFCKEAAKKCKTLGYLAWDMALTEKGWLVIEVNEVGQILLPQMVYEKGLKKQFTGYLNKMESMI